MLNKIGSRLNRILLMVPLILREEGASMEELCDALGAGREEILADLDVLFLCGLPDYGPGDLIDRRILDDRVYLSMADFFSRPLTITTDEALALLVAGEALVGAGFFEPGSPAGSALKKVGDVVPGQGRGSAEEIARHIDVKLGANPGRWWEVIEEGLERGKDLRLEYYSFSRGDVTSRDVEPLSLVTSYGHWYLLAWCRRVEGRRLFRLDRIISVEMIDPTGDGRSDDGLEMPELVGELKPGRNAHYVKLRFSGREGRRLLEEWPAATFTEQDDGTLTVVLRTRNLSWLSRYLLRFGDRLRIESPKKLRKLVREAASKMLEVYG
ncbi:MAG: WYL domain-containing protein [Actinomycetia bacterium]|nr:WYL domain-containing protein [Actinomycetes bacterium]